MLKLDVSFWPVLLAATIYMVVGFVWYSRLFTKQWRRATGITKEELGKDKKDGMGGAYFKNFIAALVMAYVLGVVIESIGVGTLLSGAFIGFLMWAGFVASTDILPVLYEKRSMMLVKINTGFSLTGLMIMGALLAIWL